MFDIDFSIVQAQGGQQGGENTFGGGFGGGMAAGMPGMQFRGGMAPGMGGGAGAGGGAGMVPQPQFGNFDAATATSTVRLTPAVGDVLKCCC